MRGSVLAVSFATVLLGAACSTPRVDQRDVPAPRLDPDQRARERANSTPTEERATEEFLDKEMRRRAWVPPPASAERTATATDEQATADFLDREMQRRTPPPEPVQVTERTVYVEVPRREWVEYDPYYDRYVVRHGYDWRDRAHRERRSSFPLGTAVGAGIGAIIGHQSGHRGRGAAIGAGAGLLVDLFGR